MRAGFMSPEVNIEGLEVPKSVWTVANLDWLAILGCMYGISEEEEDDCDGDDTAIGVGTGGGGGDGKD